MKPAPSPTKAAEGAAAPKAALAARFGPGPFSSMRRVRRVLTDTPKTAQAISEACGLSIQSVRSSLNKLVEARLARNIRGFFVRCGSALPVLEDEAAALQIGRQILLCLTEPRRTRDIARIINRSPSNTTGQLQHLLRRGLVVRVSKGVYDVVPPEPVQQEKAKSRSKPGRQRQAEHRQKLAETGLVQVAAWVPDGHQASILDLARQLRSEAGVFLPTEIPASAAGVPAMQGA